MTSSNPIPVRISEQRDDLLVVVADLINERHQQAARWGEQNHPDGTGTNWVDQIRPAFGWSGPEAVHAARLARNECQRAARRNNVTWLDILREEVAEAFAETDPIKLRTELVQVMAVTAAWIEAIDRRSDQAAGATRPSSSTSEGGGVR